MHNKISAQREATECPMPLVHPSRRTLKYFLLIGLLLRANSSYARSSYPFKTDRIPYHYLFDICFEKHLTCVIDLTSETNCDDITPSTGTVSQQFDAAIAGCPQYKWRKAGRTYLVEPSNPSDSALSIIVGPIKKEDVIIGIMCDLIDQSHLATETPGSNGGSVGGDDSSGSTDPFNDGSRTKFSIPAESFKNALLTAAKQRDMSTWLVVRLHDDAFYYKARSNAPEKKIPARTP